MYYTATSQAKKLPMYYKKIHRVKQIASYRRLKSLLKFFQIAIQFYFIKYRDVKKWSEIELQKEDPNELLYNVQATNFKGEFLTLIENRFNKKDFLKSDFEKIGRMLTGFLYKELRANKIDLETASRLNHDIQNYFSQAYNCEIGAVDFNDKFQLAKQNKTDNYEKESKKLKKYLYENSKLLDAFLKKNKLLFYNTLNKDHYEKLNIQQQ